MDMQNSQEALSFCCNNVAKQMAADGEGATRLVEVTVAACKTKEEAICQVNRLLPLTPVKRQCMARMQTGDGFVRTGLFRCNFNPEVVDLTIHAEEEQIIFKDGVPPDFE